MKYTSLLDMMNGGGQGQAGDDFENGMFSDLLNAMGIDPMGYADRARAAAAPAGPTAGSAMSTSGYRPPMPAMPQEPAASAPQTPAVTTTPLGSPGAMPLDQLLALLKRAMAQPPSAAGYGPR